MEWELGIQGWYKGGGGGGGGGEGRNGGGGGYEAIRPSGFTIIITSYTSISQTETHELLNIQTKRKSLRC